MASVMPASSRVLFVLRYAAAVGVTLATIYAALQGWPGITASSGWIDNDSTVRGWPLFCMRRDSTVYLPPASKEDIVSYEWAKGAAIVDVIAVLTIISCSFYVAHCVWPRFRSWQFRLPTLFHGITVVAVLTVLLCYEYDIHWDALVRWIGGETGGYFPITLYPWWIYIPVLYGIGCCVYGACLAVSAAAHTMWRRLFCQSHSAPEVTSTPE